jgi:Ca2+-transporting ATPase
MTTVEHIPREAVAPHRGLSSAEAQIRLRQVGPNALPQRPPEALWHAFLQQFKSPLIYVLLVALLIDVGVWAGGGARALPLESAAIAIILLLNAGLGVWQERKAEGTLRALAELAAPQVWALRDGAFAHVPGAELVPGDVVRLEAGDRVPADGVAPSGGNLMVDESVLTGESMPVEKEAGSELFAGTLVVRGKTYATVTRTGAASALGKLAVMLGEIEAERTPLERRLDAFGRRVAGWVLVIAAAIAAAAIWAEGLGHLWQIVLFAVALAVAAVPEGLPAVLALTLTRGVQRMARRQAVVRRLAAVEALGSVTVIATDKTGTLTENRLEVRALDSPDRGRALRAMALASDAEPGHGVGDPIDRALLTYAGLQGHDPAALHAAHPRRSSRPFDSTWKFMRVSVVEGAQVVTYLKGAPEVVLDRCAMPDVERLTWLDKLGAHAAHGYRVLGLAWGAGEREAGLTWLGLILLWDPPRPEVPAAVRAARQAGIRVLMVTGDHPETARTVARLVGIADGVVVTGAEVDGLSADALRQVVRTADVFARVGPEHKLRIVAALQAGGDIVAVTGDGVNDAPALKRADVGVAMGQRGSDVSREVADLVLLDDNFATIIAAVEEGRSTYENIQKFVRFLFSTNLSELLVVALGAGAAFLLDLRDAAGRLLVPLTAVQLLWINLVTDGAPALALGFDRNPGVLRRPPRDPAAPLLDRASLRFVVLSGTVKALIAFALLALVPRWLGQPPEVAATAAFLFLAAGQLLFAYPARHTDVHPPPNWILHATVVLSLAVQPLIVLAPTLRAAFGTVPLPVSVWAWVAASMVASWAAAWGVGRWVWGDLRVAQSSTVSPSAAARTAHP